MHITTIHGFEELTVPVTPAPFRYSKVKVRDPLATLVFVWVMMTCVRSDAADPAFGVIAVAAAVPSTTVRVAVCPDADCRIK